MKRSAHGRNSFCRRTRPARAYSLRRSLEAVIRLSRARFTASSAKDPWTAVRVIVSQLTLLQAEALARHGVLAADRSAEIGRVVRTQRELHTGFVKRSQRVSFVALEDLRGDVGGRAHLEHDPALGDLLHQRRILDRAHAVRDAGDARQRERLAHRLGAVVLAGVARCSRGRAPPRSRRPRRTATPGSPPRRRRG